MNKILIYFLFGSIGITSCSSKSNETKEKTQQEDSLFSNSATPTLPVAFLPLDSLTFYPDARIELNTPLSNQVFKPGKVPFEFNIKNFSQKVTSTSSQRFAMILNGGEPEYYAAPIFQRELTQGTYRSVAFLLDSNGITLKNFGNYVDRDFLVGDSRPFPYSAEPYLAINLPRNEQILPFGKDLILDFLVLGGDLELDGLKVKVWVNGYQTTLHQVAPIRVTHLPIGDYRVKLQLVREDNKDLEGPFSSSTKTIYVR